MPDINLGPPPSRSPLPSILLACAVLAVVAAAVFLLNPRRTAEITIAGSATQIYTAHTSMAATKGSVHMIGAPPSTDDDLFVAVHVRIANKLRLPLFVKEITGVLTAPDSTIADADVILPADLANLTLSFPQLAPLVAEPLPRDVEVAPGSTAEGTVLLHFPHMTNANWTARKKADLTIHFFHQAPMTLSVP